MAADPNTKGFVAVNALDWCNPAAVEYCLKQFAWVCRQMKDRDYWTLSRRRSGSLRNHPHSGLKDDWYVLPVFSERRRGGLPALRGRPAAGCHRQGVSRD